MNLWMERVYERSPVPLQHVLISFYGLKLRRMRYGGRFAGYLDELEASQWLRADQLADRQADELRRLVRHCYDRVPYYGRLMRDLRLTPGDIAHPDDLAKLPILAKETVREHPELFHAKGFDGIPAEIVSTSGTSGKTLRIRVDREGRRRNYAFFARLKRWAGVDPFAKTATFAGRTVVPAGQANPPFWRWNLASRTLLCSSYHLSDRNAPAYLDVLRRWQPALIDSYPSSVDVLARFGLESEAQGPVPKAIMTSSETLRPEARERIERFFRTRVFDHYGAAEQVALIGQCEHGSYHCQPEFGITEFLPEGEDGACRIVATGFTNWAMPLLRYDTGDVAVPSSAACPCGRQFPVVERILGRVDDQLVTPDGRRIGRLDPAFKGIETIRSAQIVQEALDLVRVRIVPGEGFSSADQAALERELGKRLGPGIQFQFDLVREIPTGPGGKFRAVICQVPEPERPVREPGHAS